MESKYYNYNVAKPNLERYKHLVSEPMSNSELELYFGSGYESEIMMYKDLANFGSIDELLPKDIDYRIILIETSPNVGHWVLILKYKDTVEYFNSYGVNGDVQKNSLIPKKMNIFLGQKKDYLTDLMKKSDSKYKLIHNKTKFQKNSPDVATCGRHIALRIICCEKMFMNLKEYTDFVKGSCKMYNCNPDELVCMYIHGENI